MFTTPTTTVAPAGPVVGARGLPAATDGSQAQTRPASDATASPQASAPPPAAPAASPLKLVVAKAEASMAFTYTLVDQTTGRVIAEIPHQAAEDAAANPNYVAGGVVDTTA